ncbi:ROK family protein [Granulosicoccus sp. 3-233]|uniref:ROK family protein n=1 Tax=Granulosicoccus sp. 3-233 TaxID=3417969 RepID=UPI003D33330A
MLDTLRTKGPCTPSRLAAMTGLSAASISTLSSQMIDQGILSSERYQNTRTRPSRGRPRSLLSLCPEAGHVVTLTLTIDLIRVHLVDYAGNVLGSHLEIVDTRSLTLEQLLATICQCIDLLRLEHPDIRLRHIGVGFQGQTEHASGKLLWSPVIRMRDVPLGDTLQRRYDVSVSVHNDCRLISQALSRRQADRLGSHFATVLFGHGVGLGLYLNGQPFAGTRSSAMEIGHLRFRTDGALCRCGKRGCIEAYTADYGIERLARGLPADTPPAGRVADTAMQALCTAAESGDKAASLAFETAGIAIGEGLISVFTLLDPFPVALVGCSERSYTLMRDGICRVLDAHLVDGPAAESLLHPFEDDDRLLMQGLADNSLSAVDRLLATQQSVPEVT